MSDRRLLITIDGPAGSGKSTLAKLLAECYSLAYLDTGAMFRAAALWLGPEADSLPDTEILSRLHALDFALKGIGRGTTLLVNGQPLTDSIRTEAVGYRASSLAKLASVRLALKTAQQTIGRTTPLVAEGRDMGSVVFPEADFKFFLDAAPEERARRRWQQLMELGREEPYEELLEQIRRRDEQDRTRSEAPLMPAKGAICLDTTRRTRDESLQAMIQAIESASG